MRKLSLTLGGLLFLTTVSARANASPSVEYSEEVRVAYLALLGREPHSGDISFWGNKISTGMSLDQLTLSIAGSQEALNLSPDRIELMYKNILGRQADASGYSFWKLQSPWNALVGIGYSPESKITMPDPGLLKPPLPPRSQHRSCAENPGWVDFGNGVCLPAGMYGVSGCESHHNYAARNGATSASGRWQFMEGTARWIAQAMGRPDLANYGDNVAGSWSPRDQDEAAYYLYAVVPGGGLDHWSCGHAWGS